MKDICKEFNEEFIIVGKVQSNPYNFPRQIIGSSLVLLPTDETEIISHIYNLKHKKAVGLDDMQAKILKYIAVYITLPSSHVMNL